MLLSDAKERALDVVLTRDESRLGGDAFRPGIISQDLLDDGARGSCCFTDEEVTFNGPTSKIVVAASNLASELDRERLMLGFRRCCSWKCQTPGAFPAKLGDLPDRWSKLRELHLGTPAARDERDVFCGAVCLEAPERLEQLVEVITTLLRKLAAIRTDLIDGSVPGPGPRAGAIRPPFS
ncbi:hypothetical protein WME94_06135 [Sorangium sp. So ce429]